MKIKSDQVVTIELKNGVKVVLPVKEMTQKLKLIMKMSSILENIQSKMELIVFNGNWRSQRKRVY